MQAQIEMIVDSANDAIERPSRRAETRWQRSVSNGRLERNTRPSRLSAFNDGNVCLDLAVYSPLSEFLGDSFRRKIGRFAEARSIACLDLVP